MVNSDSKCTRSDLFIHGGILVAKESKPICISKMLPVAFRVFATTSKSGMQPYPQPYHAHTHTSTE